MYLVKYPELDDSCKLPLFVKEIGLNYSQNEIERASVLFPQIVYSVKGTGLLTVEDNEYSIPEGSCFFINRGTPFRYAPKSVSWTVNWVTFDYDANSAGSFFFLGEDYKVVSLRNNPQTTTLFEKIYSDAGNTPAAAISASVDLYHLIAECAINTTEPVKSVEKGKKVLGGLIDYIDSHYNEEFSLKKMCDIAGGISEQYLCRMFHNTYQMRPIEYVTAKKIDAAKTYLEKTNYGIPEIGKKVGFNNTSYFYRSFKKATGLSPLVYRKQVTGMSDYNFKAASERLKNLGIEDDED